MTKLPFIAAGIVVAVVGLAAPTLAAPSMTADHVPYCATGNSDNLDSRADALVSNGRNLLPPPIAAWRMAS